MSTKIYDAYKYHGKLEDLTKYLIKIKNDFIENDFKKQLITYYSPFDLIQIEKNSKIETIYLKDINRWQLADYYNSKHGAYFKEDFTLSVVTFFDNDNIYCKFNNVNFKLIEKYNVFADYHYQNQTDMSNYNEDDEPWKEMATERQVELEDGWNIRKKTWDKIFSNTWNTYDVGVSYDLSPFSNSMKLEAFNILNNTLNDKKLIRKVKIRHLNYIMKHKKQIDEITTNGGSIHDITNYCIKHKLSLRDIK